MWVTGASPHRRYVMYHKDYSKFELRATCKACTRAKVAYEEECARQEAALTAPWDAASAELEAVEDALRDCRDGFRDAYENMNRAELSWMREAMAEQSAELRSLRADNRSLRAEVACLRGNESNSTAVAASA